MLNICNPNVTKANIRRIFEANKKKKAETLSCHIKLFIHISLESEKKLFKIFCYHISFIYFSH